ncbi:hypothetical protein GY45DRAFT_1323791 [Cubamyces sp. BRFM 1775]|nr:hypothetical protein GY45DRAFT_1323791 [Cubamyces sp. BRFM 1775]
MSPLTEDFASRGVDPSWFTAVHDGVVHNPLGAAAYVYEKQFAKPILRVLGLIPSMVRLANKCIGVVPAATDNIEDDDSEDASSVSSGGDSGVVLTRDASAATVFIHIGAQPNNSPHAGTIITFAEAFLLARLLQRDYPQLRARALATDVPITDHALLVDDLRVVVQLDLVDTAPDSKRTEEIDGIVYQYSHRTTGTMYSFLDDYHALIAELKRFVGGEIDCKMENQETLMRMPGTALRDAVRTIIRDRQRIAAELSPEREALAFRSACPVEGCGMADKHGVKNQYAVDPDSTVITFFCPKHGAYTLTLENPDDLARLEMNTPLRNLTRALVYMADTAASVVPGQAVPSRLHMRVTGMDYAGTYQEQLFFRQLALLKAGVAPSPLREQIALPLIVYAPLVVDWSGAKLSKSLYVKKGAYTYLAPRGMEYLLEYRRMVEEGRDRRVLFRAVEDWVQNPAKIFRPYSLEYLHLLYLQNEKDEKVELSDAA